jgi:hypothetical protein
MKLGNSVKDKVWISVRISVRDSIVTPTNNLRNEAR